MNPKSIAKKLEQLQALGERAIQGHLDEAMLTCGTPTCGCHKDPSRRHGPHLYLRFRDLNGRSRSMYVPRSHEKEMREAVKAWGHMWQLMLELSQMNREALRERLRRRPRG
ncbi:MAG: hypothetical protein FJ280_22560 [Planctomycetes bacterium]|nr:hypothetical protein [Planctomycetota bacterium]